MITVYGRATSLNVQAVIWTLAELDLAHERLDYGFGFGGTDTPEYRAMNPNGLVPAFRDEHVTMFESAAIVRYLAARHGRAPFWPEDPVARAPIDMWAEWGKTTLQPSFLRPVFRPALHGEPVPEAARAAFERNLDILEARLGEGPWLLGARLHARRRRGRAAALPLLHRRPGPPRPPGTGGLLRAALRTPGLRAARHGALRHPAADAALMEADFVVVGSGSAGSALAYRLGEAGHSVLVLEYGGTDWGPFIQMPAALSYPMSMARYDWGFVTEPEPHLGGRRLACPRGKVLGGSSSINGMVFVRGHPRDFDAWAEMGADGWAFADVLPYFKRMETWHGPEPSEWRGSDGPLHVTRGPRRQPALRRPSSRPAREAGFETTPDYNGAKQEGFGPMEQTVWRGRRWSVANAYLRPGARPRQRRGAALPRRARRDPRRARRRRRGSRAASAARR